MKKIILTLALAAVAALSANAQQIGVNVGYTTKNFTDVFNAEAGLFVGANYNIELVNGIAVAPGVEFAMLNWKKDDNNYQKENYIAVPVMFNYGIEIVDGIKIAPYLGPTFSFGISSKGRNSISTIASAILGGSSEGSLYGENSNYTQFDILVGGGVAIEVMDMIRAFVGYNQGLLDRWNNDNATVKTSGVNFGVAYLF